jgi:hypothetical protein
MGPGVAVLDHFCFALDAREIQPMAKKTTHRANVAKKMGVALDQVDKVLGLDPRTNTAYAAAMDAEEDEAESDDAGKGGMTLEDIASMLEEVGPALGKINEALGAMAGGGANVEDPDEANELDEMEPMMDAAGKPVMDAKGNPMMQKKKAAPAVDANPAMAACDAAIAGLEIQSRAMHKALKGKAAPAALTAMDAAIVTAKTSRAKIKTPKRRGTGLDAGLASLNTKLDAALNGGILKSAMQEIAGRDRLAKRVSAFVGTFDHAEMTTSDVAKYAADKFGLKPAVGQEVTAVEAYLHNRQPVEVSAKIFGMDSAVKPTSKISNLIAGRPAA